MEGRCHAHTYVRGCVRVRVRIYTRACTHVYARIRVCAYARSCVVVCARVPVSVYVSLLGLVADVVSDSLGLVSRVEPTRVKGRVLLVPSFEHKGRRYKRRKRRRRCPLFILRLTSLTSHRHQVTGVKLPSSVYKSLSSLKRPVDPGPTPSQT